MPGASRRDIEAWLARVASRARSLDEILSDGKTGRAAASSEPVTPPARPFEPPTGTGVPPGRPPAVEAASPATAGIPDLEPSRLLERWAYAFAREDAEAFERRLSWDGWSAASARAALERGIRARPQRPAWAASLGALLLDLGDQEAPSVEAPLPWSRGEGIEEPPFVHLWLPLAARAEAEVAGRARAWSKLLEPEARGDLVGQLLTSFSRASAPALQERFEEFRTVLAPQLAGRAVDPTLEGRVFYLLFLQAMREGELAGWLERYAMLARQIARLRETWVDRTAEFLDRLEADFGDLTRSLRGGEPLGGVAGIAWELSDRHRGGRRVLGLAFSSGARIYYKPRPVDLDAAVGEFFDDLRARGLAPAPPSARTLTREGYGWVAHVPQARATSAAQAAIYFQKAGALLFLAHLLGGSDLHMENLVAGPEGPTLIDAEPFLLPRREDDPSADEDQGSFVSSGLLSFLKVDPRGGVYDIGGLLGLGGHLSSEGERVWRATNTDSMRVERIERRAPAQSNVLLGDDGPIAPERHANEIAEGFAAAYRFLLAERERPGSLDEGLERFRALPCRAILRDSNLYATVLAHLLTPPYQGSGSSASILIETMNRVFAEQQERPSVWPAVVEERVGLLSLDLPYFTGATDAPWLAGERGVLVPGFFRRTGFDLLRERLASLSEQDLARHLRVLRFALPARSSPVPPDLRAPDPLLRISESIAAAIRESARADVSEAEGRDARGILEASFLYEGRLGTALFYAALHARTRDPEHATLARRWARPVLEALGTPGAESADLPLGACNGWGGIVYSLVLLAGFLGEPVWEQAATQAAGRITLGAIARDRCLDVESGSAGALLGLLALLARTGEPAVLAGALACGEHLLGRAEPGPRGGRAWVGADGVMRPGFAHGASGIALSLARLAAASRQNRFLEAVRAAIDYETTQYDPVLRDWPAEVADGSIAGRKVPMGAWCHGGAGIALARVAMSEHVEEPWLKEDLARALDATIASGLGRVDHLCCGNMGRLESLLVAATRDGDPAMRRVVSARAVLVMRRALERGGFTLSSGEGDGSVPSVGFFRGLAGIGYELLRLAAPERVPSVLLFEQAGRDR